MLFTANYGRNKTGVRVGVREIKKYLSIKSAGDHWWKASVFS